MTMQTLVPKVGLSGAAAVLIFLSVGCQKSDEPKKPSTGDKAQSAKPVAEPVTASFEVKIPEGLPPLPIPKDNPMTAEKVELGKMLYFDKRMSKDKTVSCATCHDPKMAWTEHRATSKGIKDQVGDRNSPTVINAAYMTSQFWDGRAATLEEQAVGPIENPIEMGHDLVAVCAECEKVPAYKENFQKVFGTDVTKEGIAKAIAAFERTILSGNSPYDKFKAGDAKALTDAQKRGMELFMGKASCSTCHAPPIFSNMQFYNAGVSCDKKNPDEGLKKVTKKDSDMGKFRVPHLREVANTYPYFHDGSVEKLEDAVAFMAGGGKDNSNLSMLMKAVRGAGLNDQDKKDLVEFLKALSGDYPKIDPPKLP
ncbi:MAG: c-type cytochrome [Phycisphaerae bacterium]|nr:c-type cytochrome [Phycisphaerae bacterium]